MGKHPAQFSADRTPAVRAGETPATPAPRGGVLLTGLLLLAAASACPAAEDVKFNVDFSVGWDNCFRPMEWTPVEIGVTAKIKEPFGGMVRLSAQQDNLTTLKIDHPFVLTPDLPLYAPLVTKFAWGAADCEVTIADKDGRVRWEYKPDFLTGGRPLQSLDDNDLLIGLTGKRGHGLGMLDRYSRAGKARGAEEDEPRVLYGPGYYGGRRSANGRVYVRDKLIQYLPWDWTGYASLDVLILYNPEWDRLRAEQAKAIQQWVSNGGRLLIVLGARPMPSEGPIAAMIPFRVGDLRQVQLDTEEGRTPSRANGASATISAWGLDNARGKGWTLRKWHARDADTLAWGSYGFGRVGVLAFDPAFLPSGGVESQVAFWVGVLKLLQPQSPTTRLIEATSDSSSESTNSGYYSPSQAAVQTNRVLEFLLTIPELRPLSIWWVIGLLGLLAVLLGPVDYLVLKKLDKLPLTWVTSTAIIAVFTVGAYYGVQAIRAGSTQVRGVTVIDGIQGGPAWATNYSGIFASSSDDYALEDLRGDQWWSGLAPAREEYGYRREVSSRQISCVQRDGGNLPWSLPISIWSMQCLLCEAPVAQMPFSADVATRGGRVASVTLTNRTKAPIQSAWIVCNGQWASLGAVPAEGNVVFDDLSPGRWSAWTADELGRREEELSGPPGLGGVLAGAVCAQGAVQRAPSLDAYCQADDACVVFAVYDNAPSCCQVRGPHRQGAHLQLVRLVVPMKKEGQP